MKPRKQHATQSEPRHSAKAAKESPSSPTETLASPLAAVSSPDLNAERLAALKKLFPDLFTNEGRLNVDELKKVVDPALVSETERYDFRWYGKTKSKRDAFTSSRATLVYDPARSVNPDKACGNMIIDGENLEVLKLLTCAYRERIKCIYIDPPYNTGHDFVYSDNFAEGQKPYWEQTGVTEAGVKVDTNTQAEGRFHSNWLSMIHSRLLVARYLLQPDGVIFVSVDDNEVQNLRRVMDDLFGEENFIECFVWKKSYGGGAKEQFAVRQHEYCVLYARNIDEVDEFWLPPDPEAETKYYKYRDKYVDTKGPYRIKPLEATKSMDTRENLVYSIPAPDGTDVIPKRQWWWSKDRVMRALADDGLVFTKTDDGWSVSYKQYLIKEDGEKRGIKPFSVIDGIYTQRGTDDLRKIFDDQVVIQFPKPIALIQRFLQTVGDHDCCVLDFFAGSGTTAHAVMELNKADNGNRKFILVQLPELTAEDSPAFKAGYKRISDITIERAKRVVKKFTKEAEGFLPNDPHRHFADALGFKVYTLAKSHFPRAEFAPDPAKTEAENIELLKQYIREKEATFHIQFEKDKVLDEVLLKNGFMLDYTLTRQPEFKKNEVFLARDAFKESLICLDPKIAPETVDHFKTHKDQFFICLELALDTTRKWNLKHHLGEKLKAF